MATFEEIRANVRATLQDSEGNYWSDSELDRYINEGQLEYVRHTQCLRENAPLTKRENNDAYTMPNDLLEILRIENEDGNAITPTTSDDLQRRYGNFRNKETSTGGVPSWYYSDLDGEGTVRFYPRPNPSIDESPVSFTVQATADSQIQLGIPGTIYSIAYRPDRRGGLGQIVVLTSSHIGRFYVKEGRAFQQGPIQALASIKVSGTPTSLTMDADESKVFFFGWRNEYFLIQDSSNDVYWQPFFSNWSEFDLTKWTNATWTAAKGPIFFVYPPQTEYQNSLLRTGMIFHVFGGNTYQADPVNNSSPTTYSTFDATQAAYYEVDSDTGLATSYIVAMDNASSATGLTNAEDDFNTEVTLVDEPCYGVVRITNNIFIYNQNGSLYIWNKSAATATDTTYDTYVQAYAGRATSNSSGPLQYDGTHLWALSSDETTIDRYDVDTDTGALSNPVNFKFTGTVSPLQDSQFFVFADLVFIRQTDDTGYAITVHDADHGAAVNIDSFEANQEEGALVDIRTTDNDHFFNFDGEYGVIRQVVSSTSATQLYYSRKPVEGLAEIKDTLALEYYALYKAYEKDQEQSNIAKGHYYLQQFKDKMARERRRAGYGYTRSTEASKGEFF